MLVPCENLAEIDTIGEHGKQSTAVQRYTATKASLRLPHLGAIALLVEFLDQRLAIAEFEIPSEDMSDGSGIFWNNNQLSVLNPIAMRYRTSHPRTFGFCVNGGAKVGHWAVQK